MAGSAREVQMAGSVQIAGSVQNAVSNDIHHQLNLSDRGYKIFHAFLSVYT